MNNSLVMRKRIINLLSIEKTNFRQELSPLQGGEREKERRVEFRPVNIPRLRCASRLTW